MRQDQLTEKILDVKRAKGGTWKHITTEIGGVSPILIVAALLGQMKLVKPLAKKDAATGAHELGSALSKRPLFSKLPECLERMTCVHD